MKRGFTLIELMVVISIVAILSSVVLAATSAAKAKARDSQRTQEVHQIDLAVQLYKANHNGDAPDLGGTCGIISGTVTVNDITGCVAISTSAVTTNWDLFMADLHDYLPNPPKDPCTSDCGQLGYTYYGPRLAEYQCQQANGGTTCPISNSTLRQSYQLYAPLESGTTTGPSNPPLPVVSLSVLPQSTLSYGQMVTLQWSSTNASSCRIDSDNTGIFHSTGFPLSYYGYFTTPADGHTGSIIMTCYVGNLNGLNSSASVNIVIN